MRGAQMFKPSVRWFAGVVVALSLVAFVLLRIGADVGPSRPSDEVRQSVTLRFGGAVLGGEAQAFARRADGSYSVAQACQTGAAEPQVVYCELRPGRYWVITRAHGQARRALRVLVKAGAPSVEYSVPNEAAHALQVAVRIRRETGALEPLLDATVLVRRTLPAGDREANGPSEVATGEDVPFGALTDAEGDARFNELPVGPYRIQVFARGYEPYEAEIQADPLVVLRPVRALSVRVQDGGQAAQRALIHVAGLSLWPPRLVRTNAQGHAEIFGLRAGRYALTAELGERVSRAPAFIELTHGNGVQELTLELGSGEKIEVHVRDKAAGGALKNAHVGYAPSSTFEEVHVRTTNQQGLATISPLPRVNGTLQVSAAGYVARTVTVDAPGLVEVALEAGGTVRGVVEDEHGQPIVGATVKIVGRDEAGLPILQAGNAGCTQDAYFQWMGDAPSRVLPAGELGVTLGPVPPIPLYMRNAGPCPTAASALADQLSTDANGHFVAHGVAPGVVLALAEHSEYQSAKSEGVHLTSDGNVALRVTLRSGLPLQGRVLDHRDFPVQGALVRATAHDFERDIRTLADGTFRIQAAPDELTLRVLGAGARLGVVLEERIDNGKRRGEIVLRIPAPREAVKVRVLDESERPVELAEIRARSEIGREPYQETRYTSASGEALFPSARGLDVQVRIEAAGHVPLEVGRPWGELEVFRLVAATRAEGRVMAVRGRWPAPGAEVQLRCGEHSYQTHTQETGEYDFSAVARGNCQLRAHHPEHGAATQDVVIRGTEHGRPFVLPDLELSPPVQVHGVVLDAAGQKVPFAIVSGEPLPAYLPTDSAEYPDPWVRANEDGKFEFAVHFEGVPRLYAAGPGLGRGTGAFGPGAIEEQAVEIRIQLQDEAPPDAMGTVLCGLSESGGRVRIDTLLPDHRATQKLLLGDEIVAIDHERPESLGQARAWLSGALGSQVEVEVQRANKTLRIRVLREAFVRPRSAPQTP